MGEVKNTAEKNNVKKRDDQGTSTEGRKRRKRGGNAQKKAAKQQSKKKAARSSSPSSSSSSSSSESSESKQQTTKKAAKSSSPSSSSSSSSFSSSESLSSAEESYMEKKQRAVVRQESGAQESESHAMIRDISTDLCQIRQGLHDHINKLHNRLQEQQHRQMHEKLDWLIERQNNNELFNCNASIGGGSSAFNFDEEEKEDEHDNSRDGSKVGKTTEILKNRRGPQLRSTPKRSTGQDNTTHKPPAKSQSKKKSDQVQYYSSFTDRRRGEPAAVNVGANAGLKNSNVYCYSNAILQCLASCICLSDFSPSENHTEFTLNHAFASLMTSMVVGGQSID